MVKVLEVDLYDLNINSAVKDIISICNASGESMSNRCISATGAHGLVISKKNRSFRNILNNFYINLPDGMPGVWIGRMKGAKQMQRCYGPDFFKALIQETKDIPINHFFCGGKEGIAKELQEAVLEKMGNKNVVGTFCPPFREMTDEELRELGTKIINAKTDILWIGLSTPKQELFAQRLKTFTQTHFIITVGAAFDFHTGKVKQAPGWVQQFGLEWLFRALMEPKRLFSRYVNIVPLFIYYNFKELLSSLNSKKAKTVDI